MTPSEILSTTKERMNKSVEAYQREIASIRAGRANASILDRVNVNYYGVPTPLNQLAGISSPEARMLVISPYDKSSLTDIEKAILQSDIGITPSNDGDVIRLSNSSIDERKTCRISESCRKRTRKCKSFYPKYSS